jgi:hypothetical protein
VIGPVTFQFELDAAAIVPKPFDLNSYGLASHQVSNFVAISQIELGPAETFNGLSQSIQQISARFTNSIRQ